MRHLGESWGHLGRILKYIGLSLGCLGAILGHLGAILGHLGCILEGLGAVLGPLGGRLGNILGRSWAILEASENMSGAFGGSWEDLGRAVRGSRRDAEGHVGSKFGLLSDWFLCCVLVGACWIPPD